MSTGIKNQRFGKPKPQNVSYPVNGTWKLKIAYTLKVHGQVMTQYNILKYINSVEVYISPGPAKSVSSVLSTNSDLIQRYKPERGHLLYGLKEWFAHDGSLLADYKPGAM